MTRTALAIILASVFAAACGSHLETIPGTEVARTEANEELIARVEEYRQAVERKDAAALLLMASKEYWEDSGTATAEDDYGFQGLQKVLAGRLQSADSIRYAVRYMRIRKRGCDVEELPCRAFVDVLVDASYTVADARGKLRRFDLRDQNQLVLEWNGEKWMFVAGM